MPPRDVFEDHAGFDTWATMVRARWIFGVDDAVVVTQGFHMPRALFLAEEAGIHATGLVSDLHRYGYQGEKSEVREVLSRVKAIADVDPRHAGDGRPADPDRDHRRPRKLGPGAAARHAARRLPRPSEPPFAFVPIGDKVDTS